jgi:hypothetical protein
MKLNIFSLLMFTFILCSILNFSEPAAAISTNTLIDQSSYYDTVTFDEGGPVLDVKMTWKTYWYGKNTRKVVQKFYYKEDGKWKNSSRVYSGYHEMSFLIKKVSKSKIKITQTVNQHDTAVWFEKTKLSTKDYYWKVFRKKWLKHN